MNRTNSPFESHTQRYEDWFEKHEAAYLSELLALRPFVPWTGRGLEIGVGTGRFAAPLGVREGLDPSPAMLARAAARDIETADGVGEDLPYADDSFDHLLLVATLSFLQSPQQMLSEARRVLKPGGKLVIGFIDRESELGRDYQARQADNVFYREATFHSAGEVETLLHDAGFAIEAWGQTLSRSLAEISEIEPLRPGHGECGFVVVAAFSAP